MDYTPEQIDDIQTRSAQANEEITAVLEKLELATQPVPKFIAIGNGVFAISTETRLIDTKYLPKQEEVTVVPNSEAAGLKTEFSDPRSEADA